MRSVMTSVHPVGGTGWNQSGVEPSPVPAVAPDSGTIQSWNSISTTVPFRRGSREGEWEHPGSGVERNARAVRASSTSRLQA